MISRLNQPGKRLRRFPSLLPCVPIPFPRALICARSFQVKIGRTGLQILNLEYKYITVSYTSWSALLYMRAFWNINIISLWNSLVVRMVCKNNIAVSISAWERIWNYQLGARFAWLYTLRLETPYPVFNALFYWREIHRSAWEDGKHTCYNKSEHRQSTANKSRHRQLKDRAKAISRRESVP